MCSGAGWSAETRMLPTVSGSRRPDPLGPGLGELGYLAALVSSLTYPPCGHLTCPSIYPCPRPWHMKGHRPWKSGSQPSPRVFCSGPCFVPFLSPLSRYARHSLSGFQPQLTAGLTQAKRLVSAAAHTQTFIWPHPGEPDRLMHTLARLPAMPPPHPPTKLPQGRHSPPTAPPPLKSRPHTDLHVILKVFQAGVGGTPVRPDGRMGTGLCVSMDIREMGPVSYSAHSCQFQGAYQADSDKQHLTLYPWVSLPTGANGKVHKRTEQFVAGPSIWAADAEMERQKGRLLGEHLRKKREQDWVEGTMKQDRLQQLCPARGSRPNCPSEDPSSDKYKVLLPPPCWLPEKSVTSI